MRRHAGGTRKRKRLARLGGLWGALALAVTMAGSGMPAAQADADAVEPAAAGSEPFGHAGPLDTETADFTDEIAPPDAELVPPDVEAADEAAPKPEAGLSDTAGSTGTPVISRYDKGDGVALNYVLNLTAGASDADLAGAAGIVKQTGGVVLSSYPQFSSLTFQAASAGYATKLANALIAQGLSVHSIGWTRPSAVRTDEVVVAGAKGATPGAAQRMSGANPDDPGWHRRVIGAANPAIGASVLGSVRVGVLDTGIDATHPDLEGKVDAARSISCESNGVPRRLSADGKNDLTGHGTHVAGIIAARDNGSATPTGVAPNAALVDIRVLTAQNTGASEYYACGFVWAAEHGVAIANESFGGFYQSGSIEETARLEMLNRAAAYSQSKGLLHVAIAHNHGVNLDFPGNYGYYDSVNRRWRCQSVTGYRMVPASLDGVVVVSAAEAVEGKSEGSAASLERSVWTTKKITDGNRTCDNGASSSYGAKSVQIAAPGTDIWSTLPGGGHGSASGTSMAAPSVAGAAALIKGVHPEYTVAQLRQALLADAGQLYSRLAAPVDGKEYRGSGLVNALAAVRDARKREETVAMYRLYNRVSHEHLYTADARERDVLARGDWTYEGVGWVAPKRSSRPVYRLYNPILGDHHYTRDTNEVNVLTQYHGWRSEGVGWYSDEKERMPVYRQFHPGLRVGSHNYTADLNEYYVNNSRGWRGEGVAWHAVAWR